MSLLQHAFKYRELGYGIFPLLKGQKKPAFDWKEYQNRLLTDGEIYAFFGRVFRNNLAIVCGLISGGLYVKDFDDLGKAREFYQKHRNLIRTLVRTRRGIHAYFRASARNSQGQKEDGRGEGGYVVGVPSIVDGHTYEYIEGHGLVPPDELCELPEELLPQPKPQQSIIHSMNDRLEIVSRAMKYASEMDHSISGQRGHDAAFRFACKMLHRPPNGFGLAISEAWPIALMWNQFCQPPWLEKDLRRKLLEAQKKG